VAYKNREQARAYEKAWQAANAEKCKGYHAKWAKSNRANVNARHKRWEQRNPAKVRARSARQRARDPKKARAAVAAWAKAHPEAIAAIGKRRRALRAGAPVNDFTAKQWAAMKEHYGHRCAYCWRKMKRLTQDHIVPLSKGGSHTYSNIVPACQSCNSKKGTGAVLVPVQPLLLIA
jgi:5-methylcytosine-specific restriction endonuclease McrA